MSYKNTYEQIQVSEKQKAGGILWKENHCILKLPTGITI